MIFSDFLRALGQLNDRNFISLLIKGVLFTIFLLGAVTLGVQFILPDQINLPWIGEIAWASKVLSGFILVAMIGASVFLMVPVASLFISFFLEQIARAVESKHYPDLPDATPIPFADSLIDSAKFLGLMLVVNLLALAIYLLSTVLAPVIFWIVNGILLGREYFQLVAMRRLGREGANQLRKSHRLTIWFAGILMAIPLSIPFVNLLIPILGVATFTHLFHRLNS